ncbi:cytochrome c [Psychromarinibacter sp. C21-152]|uniref:Cytochrome c n=1 Tax=Psychromarinibacter sediminicola TaxID=3033385 RepID=A0AAE3NWV5_9RHOB|nr:cytochrome c [Psychromarinibacter sediminicola]MDF0603771.1 cytochrome c [Psychromarinibacter sediminicola]
MGRILGGLVVLALVGAAVFWWVTRPVTADASVLEGIEPDLARGEWVFHAGGCASCHAAEDAEGEARRVLSGGRAFPSEFGTFYAPNISPDDAAGIGDWSALDLYNAMHHGVSPEGRHYYPAFPYGTYANATPKDIVSLHAFLQTLPESDAANRPHEVGFPFDIRRSLGGWKALFMRDGWVVEGELTEAQTRGRYIAEALGHCAECHTPRNLMGGMNRAEWLSGAANPSGDGRIPNITPAALDWSETDLVAYFTSGFTPDFDSAGGHMADVIRNLAELPEADRAALAAYLKAVTPVE